MDTAIVLMAKNPIAGLVKTRLAKDLGEQRALEVYIKLLHHTTTQMATIKIADKIIYHSPKVIEQASWIPSGFSHQPQSNGGLDARMMNAFDTELQTHNKVILIGADCLGLNETILRKAIKKLDAIDVVLGPSEDGGYYLIGLKSLHKGIFKNIDWSTEKVFSQTLDRLEKHQFSLAVLPQLYDIDYLEDWERWQKETE